MPESDQDKECVPKRYILGKDAVSRKSECNKEMDAEIPELKPGAESADRPVWETDGGIAVKKDRDGSIPKTLPSQPYSIGIYIIARKSQSYSGGRVWAEPTERAIRYNACLPYKK